MEFLQQNWLAIYTLGLLMSLFCALGYVYIQTIISGLIRRYFRDFDMNDETADEINKGIHRLSYYQSMLMYFAIGGVIIQVLMLFIK